MDRLSFELPRFEPGWVWIAGAGPGDPGLVTLHVLHGIRWADVIVYDALVSDEILKLASAGCVLEYAGKRGGKPSADQPDISRRLVQLARQSRRVLRLKGGDPLVFGRGGEEALALVEADVPFRILPGISAGLGGLAYAGIPLTHREVNSVVTFLTGHTVSGQGDGGIDWRGLAAGSPVLVIYMALRNLEHIAARLLDAGRNAGEPVAIVSRASLPQQRVLETTLAGCAADAARAGIEPPALVVVGEVVRLRHSLDWLGALGGRSLAADPLGTRSESETG